MIDTDIIVSVNCDECNKKSEHDGSDFTILCKNCSELFEDAKINNIIEYVADKVGYTCDGEFLYGFNSESEKLDFLKGARYGYDHAIFELADYFGNPNDIYGRLSEKVRNTKINTFYDADEEKKLKEEIKE